MELQRKNGKGFFFYPFGVLPPFSLPDDK